MMGFFRKIIKNVLPYGFVKQWQIRSGTNAFEPGGYYSPIPSMGDIKSHNFEAGLPSELPGIDLNTGEQQNLLNSFEQYCNEAPFTNKGGAGPPPRYYYHNGFYGHTCALFLYCMIRHLNPKKIIEVGSGFSSAVMLDTNEKFMQNTIHCSFIEPYPKRLKSLLKSDDVNKVTIHEKRLQEMSLNIFSELSDNDILFIDSTHVSKFNSDVNYVIHTILPKLEKGVHIHFHDVFYPFEYPANWLLEGKAWNENYILRAFLEYNGIFKIELFDTYLQWKFGNELKERFPFLGKDPGGAIWLKKCKDN